MREREDLLDLRHTGAKITTAQGQRIYSGMSSSEVDMIRMLGVQDTGYSDRLSQDIRRAFEQLAQNGATTGRPCYGWDRRRVDGELVDVLNEFEAEVLRDIARRIIAGESLRSIVARLNELGVPSPRGAGWQPSTVRKLVLRERNVARRVHRGVVITTTREDGRAAWAPIYDDATHAAVVAVLTDPERLTVRSAQRHLLSGLLTCGKCKSSQMWVTTPGVKGGNPGYSCKACLGSRAKQETLDEYVTDLVVERVARPDALDWLAHDVVALDAARDRLAVLRGKLLERVDMFDAGDLNRDEFARSSSRIKAQIADAERAVEAVRPVPGVVRALVGLGSDVLTREAWESQTLDAKRAAIRFLMTITVGPATGRKFNPGRFAVVWRTEVDDAA
jgi:site-specific DNA recombinase